MWLERVAGAGSGGLARLGRNFKTFARNCLWHPGEMCSHLRESLSRGITWFNYLKDHPSCLVENGLGRVEARVEAARRAVVQEAMMLAWFAVVAVEVMGNGPSHCVVSPLARPLPLNRGTAFLYVYLVKRH